MKKRLTIIAPAYNEEEGIRHFYVAVHEEVSKLEHYQTTLLFVVDGCTDGTFSVLEDIVREDTSVQVLRFSRNFGHQTALLAGIDHAVGADAIIMMDSDLQHPVELIPKLLEEYEKGNEVVYTIRKDFDRIGIFKKLFSSLFYTFINFISDVPIQRGAADFRLISGRVAEILRTGIRERTLFLRGIIRWIGFRQVPVYFKANDRFAGSSQYTFRKNMHFALSGAVAFSRKPLRVATATGAIIAIAGFVYAIITAIEYFVDGANFVQGWATLIVFLTIFGGTQLFFLGVIGEYVGAIFDEVKARPHYLIEDAVNIVPHA